MRFAQGFAIAMSEIETVVVTANKREQPAQAVTSRFAVLGARDACDASGDLSELADAVSGAMVPGAGSTAQALFLHGIGHSEFTGTDSPTTASSIDAACNGCALRFPAARPSGIRLRVSNTRASQPSLAEHWVLKAGGSWLHVEYTDTKAVICDYSTTLTGALTPLKGKHPLNAPPWSV